MNSLIMYMCLRIVGSKEKSLYIKNIKMLHELLRVDYLWYSLTHNVTFHKGFFRTLHFTFI